MVHCWRLDLNRMDLNRILSLFHSSLASKIGKLAKFGNTFTYLSHFFIYNENSWKYMKNTSPIFRDESKLEMDYIPEELPNREDHLEKLKSHYSGAKNNFSQFTILSPPKPLPFKRPREQTVGL